VIEKYVAGELEDMCRAQSGIVSLGLATAERTAVAFLRNLRKSSVES
jgi:hypothetical protein